MSTSDIRVIRLRSPAVTLEPIDTRDPSASIASHASSLAEKLTPETFRYFSFAPTSLDAAGVGGFIERVAAMHDIQPFVVLAPDGRAGRMTS